MKAKLILCCIPLMLICCFLSNKVSSEEVKKSLNYEAVVYDKKAIFNFPITPKSEWEWCRGPEDTLEYEWSVSVENNGNFYKFGYFLYVPPNRLSNCKKLKGSFQELLKQGQFSVFTSGSILQGKGLNIKGFTNKKKDNLTIEVSGDKAMILLFSNRPKHCKFNIYLPDKKTFSVNIPIGYDKN